jgi:hypothetical protein
MQTAIGTRKYGMNQSQSYGSDVSAAANGAVGAASTTANQLGIENPMLWLVGIGAVTLGLVAFSTHVRVGKFAASASAG